MTADATVSTRTCPDCGLINEAAARVCEYCRRLLTADGAFPSDAVCRLHPPTPATWLCARCGNFGCTSCLSSAHEGDRLCEPCSAEVFQLAWDRRATVGVWAAWSKTTAQVLRGGEALLRKVASGGPVLESLGYAALSLAIAYVPVAVLQIIIVSLVASPSGRIGGRGVLLSLIGIACYAAIDLFDFLVLSGLVNAILRVAGSARPFAVTFRAFALSLAGMVLMLVPCFGGFGSSLATVFARYNALRAFHDVSAPLALAAVAPSLLLKLAALASPFALALL